MHILLIHQVFLTPNQGGGTRHFELGRFCVQQGHQFTVIASDVSYLDGKRIESQTDRELIEGIHVIRAKMMSSLHKSFVWRIAAFISFMFSSLVSALKAGRVDIVMGTSPPLFQALSAWMVALIRRRPFLLEIRDLWPEFAIDMGILSNPLLIWLSRRLEHFLYQRADHLLVNSPAYRDYLIELGIDESKVSLVTNGVDPSMFDPDETGTAIRNEFDLNGMFVVTYAGAIGPANDIGTIIRAAGRLADQPDIHFLIIGDGKDRPKIEKLVNEMRLTNVTLGGLRPKSDMKALLGASDACVATLMNIPMFTMPYPNKVFDYMAAGRPTLLGIDGVIRKVIEDAKGGLFFPPGNDKALAEAVYQLYTNSILARQMGDNARAFVIQHFDRKSQADSFIRLLETMVGDQPINHSR